MPRTGRKIVAFITVTILQLPCANSFLIVLPGTAHSLGKSHTGRNISESRDDLNQPGPNAGRSANGSEL
jgi:hypothetical protein